MTAAEEYQVPNRIKGAPTKRFFVSMLVRDIDLKDAILDLIDNCVDGAMRCLAGNLDCSQPYNGYYAKITINSDNFEILDNCGGIAPDILESAFKLGRPDPDRDSSLPTVGMYGIGMKRAIFKLGKSAIIETKSSGGEFTIRYSEAWLDEQNDDWMLDVEKNTNCIEGVGTRIFVDKLSDSVLPNFKKGDLFLSELKETISKNYGYILTKGFKVFVNETLIDPVTLQIRASNSDSKNQITPFVYEGTYDEVDIFVTVGFYRPPPKASFVDEELEGASEGDEAGISIICNDRVVLHNDRTRITGWGEQRVPKYHTQFSSISGLVVFSSNSAENLPLTTTKRGIDQGSNVYWLARDQLMKGLKTFTDFTNKWKGREDETVKAFRDAPRVAALQYRDTVRGQLKKVRGDDAEGAEKTPSLPMPEKNNPMKRVSFVRPETEIKKLSSLLFDTPDKNPAEVGALCFDNALKEADE